ncbi:hypothetical protein ACHAXS_000732 [Conticribra weissflogii]
MTCTRNKTKQPKSTTKNSDTSSVEQQDIEHQDEVEQQEVDHDTNNPRLNSPTHATDHTTPSRPNHVIFNKSLSDVILTATPTNPVDNTTTANKKKYTHLRSIDHFSIPDIKLDDLRSFSSRNRIKGVRRFRKDQICEAIVYAKRKWEEEGVKGPYWCPGSVGPVRKGKGGREESAGGAGDSAGDNEDVCEEEDEEVGLRNFIKVDSESGKKRRRDDGITDDETATPTLPSMALGSDIAGAIGEGLLPRNANDNLHGNSQYMNLQKVIAHSIKEKNSSVALKELVDAASQTLRDVREERKERRVMFRDLMELVGNDDTIGREYIRKCKNSKLFAMEESDGLEAIDMSEETREVVESIVRQDELIERLSSQHLLLSHKISVIMQSLY